MRIMPPDDPTAVYPIGQVGPLDDDDASEEQEAATEDEVTEPAAPPIEASVASVADPGASGGFNPLIAVAVLAVGAMLAATVLGITALILLLIQ